jgi:hypothetical protein
MRKRRIGTVILISLLVLAGQEVFLAAQSSVDITNQGGTVSAQYSDSPTGEDIAKLVDNSSTTKYLTFHASGWAQFQANAAYTVTSYTMTSANDAAERDPLTWTFQGSANGTTWTTIDSRSGEDFATRLLKKTCTITNTVSYTYYRLNMTNNSGTILQLAEWEIFGTTGATAAATSTSTPTAAATPTPAARIDITNQGGTASAQYTDSPAGEEIAKLFDNSGTTKYLTFHASAWVQFQANSAYIPTSYEMTSANDAAERDPLTWTFQGSANGSTWITIDSRSGEDFATRYLVKSYTVTGSTAYTYFRLNMTNNSGTILQLAELNIYAGSGPAVTSTPTMPGTATPTKTSTASPTKTNTPTPTPAVAAPPAAWTEHWFEHVQVLTRVFYDNDAAIYFDSETPASITWMNQYCGDVWRYVKQNYGDMDGSGNDPRLFAIFHTNKYSGGHPSYYYDSSHDYRNVIDIGAGPWDSNTGWNLDGTTHEVGHIVESVTNGAQGSPCFSLWGDSKWCEIFNYDVYVALGKSTEATRWYNAIINGTDTFPVAGTQWFKNWFYPIWNQYGKGAVLSKFFKLMSQYFPKSGSTYSRSMNWGEFVHFWSGAAGINLKSLATTAFTWPSDRETQWQAARSTFTFTYTNY